MEFSEKLQELRKSRGLTQEELAKELYVSRTAISKWESGRGYPNIDSLKEISGFFSVSIDELLSSDKLVYIAEKESGSKVIKLCDLLFGIVDLMTIALILLPLYPSQISNFVYSVNLFAYADISKVNWSIHLAMFSSLVLLGAIKVITNQAKIKKGQKTITVISIVINIAMVLFLASARDAYATIIAFVFLLIKGMLIIYKGKKYGTI